MIWVPRDCDLTHSSPAVTCCRGRTFYLISALFVCGSVISAVAVRVFWNKKGVRSLDAHVLCPTHSSVIYNSQPEDCSIRPSIGSMNTVDISRCGKRIVQYIWDPEPKNDEEPAAPIWCLGIKFIPTNSRLDSKDEAESRALQETAHGWPEAFLLDFESKFWMTYRSNFPPIPKSEGQDPSHTMTLGVRLRSQLMDAQGFTSDTGWGCMIRSGQCLLANAMSSLLLGRGWRRGDSPEKEAELLSLFADHPEAPLSIHRFVKHGAESCGKHPGEWFGPSATARCIEALSAQHGDPTLRVYATKDSPDVYEDEFMKIACSESNAIQPTLILLGTRLGIDHITPVYWDSLKEMLQFPQSVGIAGGRPSASHYFVGVQGSYLFYLDPHNTRSALPYHAVGDHYTQEDIDSCHTRRLRRIHVSDMDPSMLIGFLIKDERDWIQWKERASSTQGKRIIHIASNRIQLYSEGREEALDEVEALDDAE